MDCAGVEKGLIVWEPAWMCAVWGLGCGDYVRGVRE